MTQAISGATLFVVQTLIMLASFAFVLRFMLQAVRADFYNPLSQAIVRITDPVLKPLRRIVPAVAGLDLSPLLIAMLLQGLYVMVAFTGVSPLLAFMASGLRLLDLVLDIFWFSLIILVIASFVAPGSRHPGIDLVTQLTTPLVEPFRRLIPPMGGLDFSVLVVFIILNVVSGYLLPGLAVELGLSQVLLR